MKENNTKTKELDIQQPRGGLWFGGTYGHYDEELGIWVKDGTNEPRYVDAEDS